MNITIDDKYYLLLMTDDWWLMTDDWWLMTDDWWLMTDDWWLKIDNCMPIDEYNYSRLDKYEYEYEYEYLQFCKTINQYGH